MTNNMQRRLVDKLWHELPKLGGNRNGFRSRARGGQPEEVRALRNADYWNSHLPDMPAEDVKAELAKTGKGIGFRRWTADGVEMI